MEAEKRKERLLSEGTGLLSADLEKGALGALQGALHHSQYVDQSLEGLMHWHQKRLKIGLTDVGEQYQQHRGVSI